MHQRDRFALGEISPPASRNRPQTETNLADRQVCILVSPKKHEPYLTTELAEVTENYSFSPYNPFRSVQDRTVGLPIPI